MHGGRVKVAGMQSKEMRGNCGSTWYRHGINLPSTRGYAECCVLAPGGTIGLPFTDNPGNAKHLWDFQDLSAEELMFRAKERGMSSEVGEVWGFLQSNVESCSEGGSCIRFIIIIIYYRIQTFLMLANMRVTSPSLLGRTKSRSYS